jgi:predicted MPP superfamily phosphohydrolase
MNRRRFLQLLLGSAATAGVGWTYARHVEPTNLQTDRLRLPLRGLRAPLKILHLSDLHASRVVPLSLIGEAFERGLAEKPDMVCLTGDFITSGFPEGPEYGSLLATLGRAVPCFACPGNHDGKDGRRASRPSLRLLKLLAEAEITLLVNRSLVWDGPAGPVRITGLGDLWAGMTRPHEAWNYQDGNNPPHLVLCHNPDSKELLRNYPWDLMLCGHTHGGQLRIPFLGAPLAPVRDKSMIEGLHSWDGRLIHITRGVGNLHGIRINCPPQINILHLQPV